MRITQNTNTESKMPKRFVPVHNTAKPLGGIPGPAPPLTSSTPVYSNYTGDFIGYGPIEVGTPNDAPFGNKQHGGVFHVIQFINGAFIAHNR